MTFIHLRDAVRAGRGLAFDCGIPPRFEENHVACGCEVHP